MTYDIMTHDTCTYTISEYLTRCTRIRRKYFRKSASKGFTFVKKRDII
uniref:Uncharacterized protein n=1 Tax=Phage sp. ctqZP6 TaxID=2828010 RepID=A0A8S5SHV6_9VIRU|nr:MAG TPA: hypothetical protein [Phage sp. ctqZP6]